MRGSAGDQSRFHSVVSQRARPPGRANLDNPSSQLLSYTDPTCTVQNTCCTCIYLCRTYASHCGLCSCSKECIEESRYSSQMSCCNWWSEVLEALLSRWWDATQADFEGHQWRCSLATPGKHQQMWFCCTSRAAHVDCNCSKHDPEAESIWLK